MLRRSSPALLCLLVCLLAARFATADASLRVAESDTRVRLTRDATEVALAVVNPPGRDIQAHILVELIDTKGEVRARAERADRIAPGPGLLSFALGTLLLDEKERPLIAWYRLLYAVTPGPGGPGAAIASGVVSLSEVTTDLFELGVSTPAYAVEGMRFRARVRATRPATQRPAKGVRVQGSVALNDERKTTVRAEGTSDGEGLATLDFD